MAADIKSKLKLQGDLVFATEKSGKLLHVYGAKDSLSDVSPKDNLFAFEVRSAKDSDVVVELNFYKKELVGKGKKQVEEIDILRTSVPRLVSFAKSTSFAQMREKVTQMLSDLFDEETLEGSDSPISLKIRDNLPTVQVGKYGARRSGTCDFCKEQHGSDQEFCSPEVYGLDCSKPEVASKVTLESFVDQMYWDRQLAFAVIIDGKHTSKWRNLKHEVVDSDGEEAGEVSTGIDLKSCFEAYSGTDLLTGDNQYYCKKCKTHTDSNKKLEIYKVPKIMILQLKRFC